MRKTFLVGVVLSVAAAVVVALSAMFDLELESIALLGASLGAVVALVPDGRPGLRLAGFAAGIVAAWVGYLMRAALLPDSTGGQAVAIVLVLILCAVVATASVGKIPLWSTLVGVGALVGAFETAYVAAPSQVASTSVTAVTSIVLAAAVGFLAAALVGGDGGSTSTTSRRPRSEDTNDEELDIMKESAR